MVPNIHTGRQTAGGRRRRKDEWQTRSGRWKSSKVEERKNSFGETDGWGVSKKKDMAVSQHTQLSRSFCVVSSERHSHSHYIPGKGRCLNGILYCSLPLSPPRPLHPSTQSTYLQKQNKKGNMRALSHSDTDHHVELERGDRQFPSKPHKSKKLRCTKETGTQGSACSSRAKSTWII